MTGSGEALNHRAIGVDLFNRVWDLMDKQDRTVEDDDAMLHMAHVAARRVAADIAEDEDRKAVLSDLASIPGLSGEGFG